MREMPLGGCSMHLLNFCTQYSTKHADTHQPNKNKFVTRSTIFQKFHILYFQDEIEEHNENQREILQGVNNLTLKGHVDLEAYKIKGLIEYSF